MPPPSAGSADCDPGALASAWRLLLAARTAATAAALGVDAAGAPAPLPAGDPAAWLERGGGPHFRVGPGAPAGARTLLDLYAPLCGASRARPLMIGHLGQSLDGCIATASGDSYYITGPDNLRAPAPAPSALRCGDRRCGHDRARRSAAHGAACRGREPGARHLRSAPAGLTSRSPRVRGERCADVAGLCGGAGARRPCTAHVES